MPGREPLRKPQLLLPLLLAAAAAPSGADILQKLWKQQNRRFWQKSNKIEAIVSIEIGRLSNNAKNAHFFINNVPFHYILSESTNVATCVDDFM